MPNSNAKGIVLSLCDYSSNAVLPWAELYIRQSVWLNGVARSVNGPKRPICLKIQGSKMHRLPPSSNRQNLRSETPMGFARAVFDANDPQYNLGEPA